MTNLLCRRLRRVLNRRKKNEPQRRAKRKQTIKRKRKIKKKKHKKEIRPGSEYFSLKRV